MTPHLHRDSFREVFFKRFVPENEPLAPARSHFSEQRRESWWLVVAYALVSPEVQVGIWKQLGKFREQLIKFSQHRGIGAVHEIRVHAKSLRSLARGRIFRPIRKGGQEGGRMSGNVDFWNHAYAEVRRELDQFVKLFARVAVTRRCPTEQGRSQPLIIREMQVQHIEAACPHAEQCALERRKAQEAARRVEHEPSPCMARRIASLKAGQLRIFTQEGCEQRESANRSPLLRRRDLYSAAGNAKRIGLVHVRRGVGCAGALHAQFQTGDCSLAIKKRNQPLAGGGRPSPHRTGKTYRSKLKRTARDLKLGRRHDHPVLERGLLHHKSIRSEKAARTGS